VDSFKAFLLEGGHDQIFDTFRAELASTRSQKMGKFHHQHVLALCQSDHLPIFQAVPSCDGKVLKVWIWNVMEFPCAQAANPVLDGVTPYCDQLLRDLKRKGNQEKELLLEGMSSELIIAEHNGLVLQKLREVLELQVAAGDQQPAARTHCESLQGERLECLFFGWN